MSTKKNGFWRRKRWLWIPALVGLVLVLGAVAAVQTGLAEGWARRAIVAQLERMTGGRVELGAFHFQLFRLRAQLDNLTIHGYEPEGTSPFFHADTLLVDVRVDSLFRRKISLDEVRLDRPSVHVRFEADGRSNVPVPKRPAKPARPWRERIFEVATRHLRLNDGSILFNDVRVPLVAEGDDFHLAVDYSAPPVGQEFYLGQLSWKHMTLALRRYLPFASTLAVKFSLERNRFEINQLRWDMPHTQVDAQLTLASFTSPAWSFRYRGRLGLQDVQTILRKPNFPGGDVDFSGEGSYAGKQLSIRGRYAAHDIMMPYRWFHTTGISSRGTIVADHRQLEIPDFEARVLGGVVLGRVHLDFHGLQFRVDSRGRGMDLARLLGAVNNESFPVETLHWAGVVDINAVTTWTRDFKRVESRGISLWAPPIELREGEVSASARLEYRYIMDRRAVFLSARSAGLSGQPSEISTPTSRVELSGVLGALNTSLDVTLDARDLEPWDDLINRLRGREAEPRRITGSAQWQGRIAGPIARPTFRGHFRTARAHYDRLYWDEVEGDLSYSPEEFRLVRTKVRHGSSTADLELWLSLDDWSFVPESPWGLEVGMERASTDDLQNLLGWSYPLHGLLTGQFHGRGTRSSPELTGLFDLADVDAWGLRFERARGQLNMSHEEIRIANAELRLFPGASPRNNGGRAKTSPPVGIITGNFLYRIADEQLALDLTGAGIRLEQIDRIQTARLPLGGQLSLQLKAEGPLRTPTGKGSLRLVDFRVGKEVLGSFEGKISADGRRLHIEVDSAMAAGQLHGQLDLGLGRDYPVQGEATVERFDLDPFIQTALHLTALTGHSSTDGRFQFSGALARPETIVVDANLSRLALDYQYVKLENVGPLRLTLRHNEVRVEQAHLRGTDTDLRLSGFARFAGDRRVGLNLLGAVNLRMAGGFLPGLEARGAAQVNASVEGTLARPRIIGSVQVQNAAANYGDFPAGLSQVNGVFIFDTSRLVFENVGAEIGGGQILLGGTLTYGDGPLRYDLTARATRARIRYPEGISWLAGGNLRLSGTRQAALLSGRVVVERVLMGEDFDLASLLVAAKSSVRGLEATPPFLRNLQFDIEAVSSSDARLEWTGARFESEASMRIRGTWEHPILLGHIHFLSGEMTFRGNRYRLTRGDINFAAQPFGLGPDLNVEAVTTIRQYEVTLDLAGSLSKLSLSYRSDPPLPSSDIISLLALGRTGEESELRGPTAVQTPELGATTLLSEAISSQLGGRLERLFGISRFRVDPFPTGAGSEQNAAARVTIEQQVTRDLVITYITNVTSTQQQVIQVEYNVNRNISIVALRDYNGTFGLDVKFKKRFK